MANKIVALFFEGPTENEFYRAVINKAREKTGTPFDCDVVYKNLKGIGNYKKSAMNCFLALKKKNPGTDIYLFLCIDNDAFEFSSKPPFDKKQLQKELRAAGAKDPTFIIAKQSIEDWFLYDLPGVINYLHLNKTTKRPKGNGQKALQELFKRGNRLYIKGSKTKDFIDKLDVIKIMQNCCTEFSPLCKILKLDHNCICKRQ